MSKWRVCGVCWFGFCLLASALPADDPVTLENVKPPEANKIDEPVAKEYSLDKAVGFLDSVALTWQKQRQCFTCHTNYAYLYARPQVDAQAAAHQEVRKFAEEMIEKRWPDKGPRWDAEVVATAAALAYNDSVTTGKLHPLTKAALDKMWTVQKKDGGWNWIKCGWPPMEYDDDYGAGLGALAVAVAPEEYRKTEAAQAGIAKLKEYLAKNPPPTLHHSAMLLWASSYGEPFLTAEQQKKVVDELLALQRPDGGWNLPSLLPWKRDDGSAQSTDSDGYGTGFTVYVLRRSGIPAEDPRLQKAVSWLKQNQRESGRWFTRSLKKDSNHFISHAGTAFAVMAIQSCEGRKTASTK